MLTGEEEQQCGRDALFIYKKIIGYVATTGSCLNSMTVRLLVLEHAVVFRTPVVCTCCVCLLTL